MDKFPKLKAIQGEASTFGKIAHKLGAPQRYLLNKAASALGVQGNPNNSEQSSQAIIENLAQRAGIPEDSTVGNAVKAAGVAGLEVFGDPLGFIPVGKIAKGAKALPLVEKTMPAVTKAVAPAAEIVEKFPTLKKMFQVGDVKFPASNTAEAIKVKQALEAQGKVSPDAVIQALDSNKGF